MAERTLYQFLFEEAGIEGTGPIERLEGVYRRLYKLTTQHPRFRRAMERGDERVPRVLDRINGYLSDLEIAKILAAQDKPYETQLARAVKGMESWANQIEKGYQILADAFWGKTEQIEKIATGASDIFMVAIFEEVRNCLDQIKEAQSKPATEATEPSHTKTQDVDALVQKLGEAIGKLDQVGGLANQLLEKRYGLSETDLVEIRKLATAQGQQIDYNRLSQIFSEAARGVTAKVDRNELYADIKTAVDAALQGKTFSVDSEALKKAVEEALKGKEPTDRTALTSAVSEALGNYFRDRQISIDPNSVKTSVDKAFDGRTLGVDQEKINSYVAAAVDAAFGDRRVPIDLRGLDDAVKSAVEKAMEGRTVDVNIQPIAAAVKAAIDAEMERRSVPVDPESVNRAVDAALRGRTVLVDEDSVRKAVDNSLKGRTIPVDQRSVDTAVSSAFGGIREELGRYATRLQELGGSVISALTGYRAQEPERGAPPRRREAEAPPRTGGASKPSPKPKAPAAPKPAPKPAPADDDLSVEGGPVDPKKFVDDLFEGG